MFHMREAPPEAPLREAVRLLEGAGLVVALGGSGLLAALGIAEAARDWDLTTDASADQVEAALDGRPHERCGPDRIHADHKLRIADGAVEVICRLAFRAPSGIVRIPTTVSARVEDIPLGSPEAWAAAYALLAREEKFERLMSWLARQGADPGVIARLGAEPLPAALAARLRSLPPAPPERRGPA